MNPTTPVAVRKLNPAVRPALAVLAQMIALVYIQGLQDCKVHSPIVSCVPAPQDTAANPHAISAG